MNEASGLQRRAQEAVELYEGNRRSYIRIARHVHDTLRDKCDPAGIHTIEYRAKDISSFRTKALKGDGNGGRYRDPINEITDLAGVRVIVFLRETVNYVCQMIASTYDVIEQEDVGERTFKQGRFGYQSIHMLVALDKRQYIGSNDSIKRAICEIQVRTILQHAWAEMEHDIQYKGDAVPVEMARRFSALAGLLELADGEFQRIQADSQQLMVTVQTNLVNDLTQQAMGLPAPTKKANKGVENVRKVRDLVSQERYHDAMAWYNAAIKGQPTSHTLLIGRAKVSFLMGNVNHALRDLELAEEMNPDDPAIERTRFLIESGNVDLIKPNKTLNEIDAAKIEAGFASIEQGMGLVAFEYFTELEKLGYNRAFATFNKSMACAVEGDVEGARDYIDALDIIPTTPMSVNILAIHFVLDELESRPSEKSLHAAKAAYKQTTTYSLQQSRLLPLIRGLVKRNHPKATSIVKKLAFLGNPLH